MSYITQIILKYGSGNPGTVLEIGEAAYDASNNILYVGNGVGNPATAIGPADVSGLASIAYVDGSLAYYAKYPDPDYTYGNVFIGNEANDGIIGVIPSNDFAISETGFDLDLTGDLLSTLAVKTEVPSFEYQFITSDYELTAPEGANRRLTIKNLSTNDVSIYCLTGYSIDNKSDRTLLSMNTVELYDYDASNWYIV